MDNYNVKLDPGSPTP